MEKKTIGKFIAALRKANGITQRELGEKLYVSDKTVSRWERNESTPELSLIPAIAEIFGVTSDELIRGERMPSLGKAADEEAKERQKAKSGSLLSPSGTRTESCYLDNATASKVKRAALPIGKAAL